ncbi:MAG: amidohydrolase family protein [Pseudomonadota bacterium]
MPDFPIIDAHLHLYDPHTLSFPWMAGNDTLNTRHEIDTLHAARGTVEVEAAVFVEVNAAPGQHMDEAQYVEALAAKGGLVKGIVASMPLEEGADAVAADLETFAAMKLARGVRRLMQLHVDEPGWSLRSDFVAGVQSLAKHGLTFDLCILHPQMGEAIELVRRCPDVSFVLDHIGKPGIKAGLREPWWSEMKTLAAESNVSCKISGVVTEADHDNWTPAEVKPYIAHAIDCFGFDRVMFGGDWPVSKLATTYPDWVTIVDEVVESASPEDKRKLFRDNAIAFYRLGV